MEDESFAWERLEFIAAAVGIEITWLAEYEQWMVELGNRQVFTGADLAAVVAEARCSIV